MRGVSESFKRRADSAAFWEAWTGVVLTRAGMYVTHYPFECDGAESHGQTWDLDVGYGTLLPVEVKSLNLTFTGPEDYPYDTAMVCSARSWTKKWPGERSVKRDFLLVSRETGDIVWIPKGSPTFISETADKERNGTYKVIKVHKEHLKHLHEFVEHVQETTGIS